MPQLVPKGLGLLEELPRRSGDPLVWFQFSASSWAVGSCVAPGKVVRNTLKKCKRELIRIDQHTGYYDLGEELDSRTNGTSVCSRFLATGLGKLAAFFLAT